MHQSLVIVLGVLLAYPGLASAMRCAGGLIEPGSPKIEVINKCGQPVLKDDTGRRAHGSRWIYTEKWTYDMGRGKFYQILEIEDGKVVSIEDGPRH
jgi:hypothetical protein